MSANRQVGAEAMSLYILDAVLRILDIRGHIPQHGEFGASRHESLFAASTATLMQILASIVFPVGLLTLALWAAVWLALKLL
jgi:hypothetical protein